MFICAKLCTLCLLVTFYSLTLRGTNVLERICNFLLQVWYIKPWVNCKEVWYFYKMLSKDNWGVPFTANQDKARHQTDPHGFIAQSPLRAIWLAYLLIFILLGVQALHHQQSLVIAALLHVPSPSAEVQGSKAHTEPAVKHVDYTTCEVPMTEALSRMNE